MTQTCLNPESRAETVAVFIPAVEESSIDQKVLRIVRQHMPITTLFNPNLKMDLNLFLKNQQLLCEIAAFLSPLLAKRGEIDNQLVQDHFKDSPLLTKIQALYTNPIPYLTSFYQICANALNETPFEDKTILALEGRIFTLKNVLIAQLKPQLIQQSQQKTGIPQQSPRSIQEEGLGFLRECLHLYLNQDATANARPFQEELTATAEQLVPFVENITKSYLIEHGKMPIEHPEHLLTYRNPTGHNYHGMVAATVMEVCLNLLGYSTKLMGRSDLEPKVTLATAHNVIMVVGPDGEKYVVDPSYKQFHQDVCRDLNDVPRSQVLVLKESEVAIYVERWLMHIWKQIDSDLKSNQEELFQSLWERDQLISFVIKTMIKLPRDVEPEDPEDWVRRSFTRVWDISSYQPILANRAFQEIFQGPGITFEKIKALNINSLAARLSDRQIVERLRAIRDEDTLEAMTLIAQLTSREKRNEFHRLLDCDPRLANPYGIDLTLNTYLRSVKKAVNPNGEDFNVIYGCSGADCLTVFSATDAREVTFVDLTKISLKEFQKMAQLLTDDSLESSIIIQEMYRSNNMSLRARYGGSMSTFSTEGKHHMDNLAFKFLYDLHLMGVNLQEVTFTKLDHGLQIDFPWQYHGSRNIRNRRVTFLTADITDPERYPPALHEKITKGFDIFYMKAAVTAPKKYPKFLPYIAGNLNANGWLMTADKTFLMDPVNPDPVLRDSGVEFTTRTSEEIVKCQELMQPTFDPLSNPVSLERFPAKNARHYRSPGSDLTYWAILTLRQKVR